MRHQSKHADTAIWQRRITICRHDAEHWRRRRRALAGLSRPGRIWPRRPGRVVGPLEAGIVLWSLHFRRGCGVVSCTEISHLLGARESLLLASPGMVPLQIFRSHDTDQDKAAVASDEALAMVALAAEPKWSPSRDPRGSIDPECKGQDFSARELAADVV